MVQEQCKLGIEPIFWQEEKQAILAQAFAPRTRVREMSRRMGISTGLLYTWRKELWKPQPMGFSQLVTNSESVATPPEAMPGEPCIELICGDTTIRIPASISPELASAIIAAMVTR